MITYCLWIGLCGVLRPRQHSMGDGFYRSKDPTNGIKVLKEMLQRKKQRTKTTKSHIQTYNNRDKQKSPAIADKPARRESLPKIAPIRRPYNVVADNTGLSSFV